MENLPSQDKIYITNQEQIDFYLQSNKIKKLTFTCISDTHNKQYKISKVPESDVLIHSGDFSLRGTIKEVEEFIQFLDLQPHPIKIVVAGNHDMSLDILNFENLKYRMVGSNTTIEDAKQVKKKLMEHCVYLQEQSVNVGGYNIYGSPWTPEFHNWGFMYDPKNAKEIWDKIPDKTDILITHGPPKEILDKCINQQNAGCPELKNQVLNRVKPLYHIFGHIHESYGQQIIENTTFINACTVNIAYRVQNKPIQFKLENKIQQGQQK
ncbi:hypothetical protein PPERSA_06832 [Pseudocohnilembus persalinus]|uniref:Calcineurin-like phosphoesterase domain-containing protein n=1 Tax=Pseudocohnilembus persalinus TaxID=266149 RepID=A0A0V0QSB0_PSEPJ|nr:hypothetical protein PPERSA_06832 [Pseudocohnilembus persalinus]|eukprot:KRX05198.1 hypothetical protein PPERSA_06832 [Pseudocohnilembus persalinus]